MDGKQSQQHRQHFNLSEAAKQMLEEMTARRYPGKQRRQSQFVEDLITEAFMKEYNVSLLAADSVQAAQSSRAMNQLAGMVQQQDTSYSVLEEAYSVPTPLVKKVAETRKRYQSGLELAPASQASHCRACKREIQPDWKHCVYCGASLILVCPTCGTPRADIVDARFCFECGDRLE